MTGWSCSAKLANFIKSDHNSIIHSRIPLGSTRPAGGCMEQAELLDTKMRRINQKMAFSMT